MGQATPNTYAKHVPSDALEEFRYEMTMSIVTGSGYNTLRLKEFGLPLSCYAIVSISVTFDTHGIFVAFGQWPLRVSYVHEI